jgi:hypothetical protein
MGSEPEQSMSNSSTSAIGRRFHPIDRRRFLQYAASVGAVASLGERAFIAAAQSATDADASSDSLLPDGKAFAHWEQPLKFTKTYFVDNNNPKSDDNGHGTQARPFRTINKAAQLLQPGERVVIASGTYRECVRPARGGTSPTQMISYEAAPGAQVYIKGSEVLREGWVQETISAGFPGFGQNNQAPAVTAWRYEFKGSMFPDAYNPFALPSLMGQWEWLDSKVVDMGPYVRRRGLVFVDGKPLEPVEQQRELALPHLQPMPDFTVPAQPQNGLPARRRGGPIMQEVGGSPNARFWVNDSGTAIHVRLESGTPADHIIEVTTRQHTFIPAESGIGYVRVKGITFQHVGNEYPFPQYGMVSLAGGDHWIVEDSTFEWANGMGISIGRDSDAGFAKNAGASQILRRNTFRYCGVEGIGGMGTSDTLIEDNLIEWCGWADAERGWEAAGAKFHRAHNMLFRRNIVRHIRHANAVWFDSGNVNCRLTSNIFADTVTVGAAVHMEMNTAQNQIDNNIIWDVRNAEPGTPGQRGCAGSGIFDNATDKLIIAQNLIGKCDNSGIFAITRPDRRGSGTAVDNIVSNNIFARCGKSAIIFLNTNNEANDNVYVGMPAEFQGFYQGDSKTYMDLAEWREAHSWDKNSIVADAQIDFNPVTLQLTITSSQPLPKVAVVNHIERDILGIVTGESRVPGPLANPSAKPIWQVDPRADLRNQQS